MQHMQNNTLDKQHAQVLEGLQLGVLWRGMQSLANELQLFLEILKGSVSHKDDDDILKASSETADL